jgi:hypothetical protein
MQCLAAGQLSSQAHRTVLYDMGAAADCVVNVLGKLCGKCAMAACPA